MSEQPMIKTKLLPDGRVVQLLPDGSKALLVDRTDYAALAEMSEAAIETNALTDEDNPPISDEELRLMRRVPDPRAIRKQMHLTQKQFSIRFQVPLGTLRDWEQGARQPEAAARTLLRVIEKNPEAVIEALKPSR